MTYNPSQPRDENGRWSGASYSSLSKGRASASDKYRLFGQMESDAIKAGDRAAMNRASKARNAASKRVRTITDVLERRGFEGTPGQIRRAENVARTKAELNAPPKHFVRGFGYDPRGPRGRK